MDRYDRMDEWLENGEVSERVMTTPDGNEIKYYVPKDYDVWSDTLEPREGEDREDNRAEIPRVGFDKTVKKWALCFEGADCGGYDVSPFVYYFDNLSDLLDAMGVPYRSEL